MEPDELRLVAQFAALAPSVHNTQPWRFVAVDNTLEVYADPDRALSYLDPDGRQLHLSCGAAVEFARIAIRSLGSACTVDVLPDANDSTLMARLTVGGPVPTTPREQRMVDAAPRRYTDRGSYTDEPVPTETLKALGDAVAAHGCWIRNLTRHEERLVAIELLCSAEEAEHDDPAYQAELAAWRRIGSARDGIPSQAYASAWSDDHRTTDVPLRDFSGANSHPRPGADTPPDVERDTLIVLGTPGDEPREWVRAGVALADFLLTLTDANLGCQPLGPVMDLPATRAQLRHGLGLIGYPQMLLRLGEGGGRPTTGRRSVDEFLTSARNA
jgi:nitroreductase